MDGQIVYVNTIATFLTRRCFEQIAVDLCMHNARVRLIARNNEVLGTVKTDSRGYARFDAGLKRGEGGLAPAVLVAETGDGDYAFLDLATGAFDLTDRGVKGRIAPGPIDAFAYTDRGVYRAGEQVHLAALARDRTGKASGVPVTVIFSRPDGVEHSRVTLTDQGQGGRATTLALAGSAMTGTWRAKIHTDPKSAAIAQASFLVEDFVPERLDLKLEPAVQALSPQEPGTIKLAGRYLYGPPANGLAVEGEIAVKLAKGDLPGFAGYKFGLADEQVAPVRKPLEGLPATNAEGKADVAVLLPALPKTSRPLEADVIERLTAEIPRHDALLISDYGKGACTPRILRSAIEALPRELEGVADEVDVLLPWGALLEGIVLARPDVVDGIAALARPGARVQVTLNGEIWVDSTPARYEDLPVPTPEYVAEAIEPEFRRRGVELGPARYLTAAEAKALPTTWARRLGHGRAHPRFVHFEGVRIV